MKNKVGIQVLNIVAFFMMLLVNFLANALPLNNLSTGEVSDMYPNLFAPAGFTFAIWGLIYLMLFLFIIYQAKDIFKPVKIEMFFLEKIGFLFIVSSFLNAVWIFSWHFLKTGLSLVIMLALLLTLVKIYLNLEIGIKPYSREENIWLILPFRIYLGWIVVASIANVTVWFVDKGWNGFWLSESLWTALVIVAATIINLLFLKSRKDIAVSAVAIWALLGIIFKRAATEPVEGLVIFISVMALAVLSLFSFMLALKMIKGSKKSA